jgi:hypothetical protein
MIVLFNFVERRPLGIFRLVADEKDYIELDYPRDMGSGCHPICFRNFKESTWNGRRVVYVGSGPYLFYNSPLTEEEVDKMDGASIQVYIEKVKGELWKLESSDR